ncbi:MAG TPA: pirin, partial [Fibrella sp.]
YLSDQRGSSETDSFRSYHTFNFGQYMAEGREPFGALYLLSEDTLKPGAGLTMQVEQPTEVVLLPIMGGLEYTSAGETHFLEPGQAGIVSLAAGTTYRVSNPYTSESINCLQIWFTKSDTDFSPAVGLTNFDLATANTLLPFFGNVPGVDAPSVDAPGVGQTGYSGFIGRFAGREEGTYSIGAITRGQTKRVFVFVLQGVFEIANRLLHEKDGLALAYQQDDVLEFEALSNDAMLIVLTC